MCADHSPSGSQSGNVGQILSRNPQSIGGLLARAQQIARLNQTLPYWRNEPWVHHLRIANLRGSTVVVFVTSAAAMVPFRRHRSAFLQWLNTQHRLQCDHLELKVRPAVVGTRDGVYRQATQTRKRAQARHRYAAD